MGPVKPVADRRQAAALDAQATRFRRAAFALGIVAVLAFVAVMQVETPADFGAAALALTVFFGLHTFANVLKEAHPINHFLEIALFSLVTRANEAAVGSARACTR